MTSVYFHPANIPRLIIEAMYNTKKDPIILDKKVGRKQACRRARKTLSAR